MSKRKEFVPKLIGKTHVQFALPMDEQLHIRRLTLPAATLEMQQVSNTKSGDVDYYINNDVVSGETYHTVLALLDNVT